MFDHEGAYDRVELEVAAEVAAGVRDGIDWFVCRVCSGAKHPTVGQLAHWGAAVVVGPETVLKRGVEYAAGADARVKDLLYVGKTAAREDRPAVMLRCDHRDGVGQQCLRPAGHGSTFAGWFTDGSHDNGHDYGGVATDALRPAEWAACVAGVR